MGLAGVLYAANHSFFSPVHDPRVGAGPIGVAAAPADLIASEYCGSNTLLTNIDTVTCQGGFSVMGQITTPNGGGCYELYLAIAPLASASATPAPFTPRDVFITSGPKIYQLRPPNPITLFATIPDGGCSNPGDHTGITFDHEGMFNFNMVVTCKGSGGVWKVDGAGTVTNIGFVLDHNMQPRHIENLTVVPRTFGPFGGQVWVADEDFPDTVSTVPGALHAIDSSGNVTLDVVEWHGAEDIVVIPQAPCTFCQNGALFQAITLDNFGPVGIYQYFPADFVGLGGNVLVPSEAGIGTALVQFNGTNYVTSVFDNIPGGIFEGASFADCDVPTPTPTFTPTATFTPTPTATATTTATATATSTATATFTPTATATSTATATFTPTATSTATFTPTATATATATATPTPVCVTAATLAASGTSNNGNTVTTGSFTLKANTTYLVFAYTNSSPGDSATFSFSGGSPTFNNIGAGSASYNGALSYEFGRWLNGGASNVTGTITVTFVNTISRAFLQVVELCGNDTSNPIAQSAYATIVGTTPSHPYTANLPAAPLASTNFDVYFLNAQDEFGGSTGPPGTPAVTYLLYQHSGAAAGTSFKDTPSQNESFDNGSTHRWGTIAVEIKRP